MENEWLIDFFEEFENPIEQEEEFDVDLIILTKGGIGGKVSVREEEDGLLERGWEKEEILKLEEGEPRGASHKHSSSSSCGDFRLSIYFIHFCYSERQKIERQRNMRVDIWKPCFILILKKNIYLIEYTCA